MAELGYLRSVPVRGVAATGWSRAVRADVNVTTMNVEVIVLNGGSSSGKSSIATCLQEQLEGTWLTLGVDDLIRALSHGPTDTTAGGSLHFSSDGSIGVGEAFHQAESAWYQGVGAIARAGTAVIVDEVFLDGGRSQARLEAALSGLSVVWVGVQCDPDVAETREIQRADRIRGQARDQAVRVHKDVRYDVVVDTTNALTSESAGTIVEWLTHSDSQLSNQ